MKMKGKAPTLLWALLLPSATGGEGKQRWCLWAGGQPVLPTSGTRHHEPRQEGAEGIRGKLLEGRANGVGTGWGPSTVAADLTGHPGRSHLKDLVNPHVIIA